MSSLPKTSPNSSHTLIYR